MVVEILDSVLKVKGIVENLDDCTQITKGIKKITQKNNKIEIIFEDSFAMPSTLIGFMLKTIQLDKATIYVKANDDLYALLDRLSLIETFNVSKI